jgi:hypothetical protein
VYRRREHDDSPDHEGGLPSDLWSNPAGAITNAIEESIAPRDQAANEDALELHRASCSSGPYTETEPRRPLEAKAAHRRPTRGRDREAEHVGAAGAGEMFERRVRKESCFALYIDAERETRLATVRLIGVGG